MQETGLYPWVGKIPWRRPWQSTPVFLPGGFLWTEEPGGLHSKGLQRVGHDWVTELNRTESLQYFSVLAKSWESKTTENIYQLWEFVVNSVSPSWLTLCHPLGCGVPGFPVLHYLLEFAQTHVHWVNEAIQPSHPLSPPSPPALNLHSKWPKY